MDPGFEPPSVVRRDSKVRHGTSPRGPVTEAVHRRLYEGLNRFVYHPLKLAIGPRRADRAKNLLRVRPIMERLFRRRGYPPLSAAERRLVLDRVGSEIQIVESLTGRDLSAWKRA